MMTGINGLKGNGIEKLQTISFTHQGEVRIHSYQGFFLYIFHKKEHAFLELVPKIIFSCFFC